VAAQTYPAAGSTGAPGFAGLGPTGFASIEIGGLEGSKALPGTTERAWLRTGVGGLSGAAVGAFQGTGVRGLVTVAALEEVWSAPGLGVGGTESELPERSNRKGKKKRCHFTAGLIKIKRNKISTDLHHISYDTNSIPTTDQIT